MPSPRKPPAAVKSPAGPARMLALLLPVVVLALSPVLFADFIRLDDHSHLFDNPHLRRMSLAGLAALWTEPYFNLYIPITYSVWWAVTMVGPLFGSLRESAWLFHGLNLAVHLANAALVFLVVRTLLDRGRPSEGAKERSAAGYHLVALASALFFALHPLQVETVAWISELKGALAATFGLLGLWWWCASGRRLPPAACFALGTLAKPSAIVFPGMVFLVNRILLGESVRKSIAVPALYGLLLLPLVLLTTHLQPDSTLDFIPTATQRLAVAADALAHHVHKVVLPFPLAVDYGRTPQYVLNHVPGWWIALAAVLLLGGVTVVVKALLRPRPSWPDGNWRSLVSCGWAIFLLSTLPVLGLVPFGFQQFSTVADRYLYVPLIGVSVMVAGCLVRFGRLAHAGRVAAALLLALAILSFFQARLWRSTESLFAHTVEVNPQSYLGYHTIAEEHLHTGRFDQSIDWAAKSLAISPDYINAQISLGLALAKRGDVAKAIDHYSAALARNPSTVGTRARHVSALHNNLGLLLLRVGRTSEASAHFRKAVEIFPRSLNARLNLGNIALDDGRYLDAIAEYEAARALRPGHPMVEQRLELARRGARRAPPGAQAVPASP